MTRRAMLRARGISHRFESRCGLSGCLRLHRVRLSQSQSQRNNSIYLYLVGFKKTVIIKMSNNGQTLREPLLPKPKTVLEQLDAH